MNVTKLRLSEVLTIKNGKDYKHLQEGDVPVFGSGGYMCSVDSYLYDRPSVLLPRKGSLANIQYFDKGKFWTVDTCFYSKINSNVANPYYIYRYLRNLDLSGFDTGASIPSMTQKTYNSLKVFLPSLQIQNKIASILSTYDSLIENNTKRIHLLEQMAENLYKEWFVRFRFPGHEKVKMVNGLPEGWNNEHLKSVCEFNRGKNITSVEMCDGNIPVISAGLTPSGYHKEANVHGVSVTMSSSGANAGYISIHYDDIWAADCSYISDGRTEDIFYVYELLNNIRPIINNFQVGSAQPHVYPKDINRIKLCIPPKKLRQKANAILSDFHKEIDMLHKQNLYLARQRDLLLPRLMSGKLEVKL